MTDFDKVIPPGSEGKIRATVDIAHLKGNVQKYVDFSSNDPALPKARLVVKAFVKAYVDVQPYEEIRFTLNKGAVETRELVLTPEKTVRLTGVSSDVDYLQAKLDPTPVIGKDGKSQSKLNVSVVKTPVIGMSRANIRVQTEGPIQEIVIPVTTIVRGPINVNPRAVSFFIKNFPQEVETLYTVDVKQSPDMQSVSTEKIDAGKRLPVLAQHEDWYQVVTYEEKLTEDQKKDASRVPYRKIGWLKKNVVKSVKEQEYPAPQVVHIQNLERKDFKVFEFVNSLSEVDVKMNPDPSGVGYNLTVSLLENKKNKKSISGTITVKTDDQDQPELKIPVYITNS